MNEILKLSSRVVAVDAGSDHACAVTKYGAVKCWGNNYWGQLGDGTTINRSTPVNVVGLSSRVVAISTGGIFEHIDEDFRYSAFHSCAITNTGSVKCWGDNYSGQLGDGTTISRLTPVSVVGGNFIFD